MFPLVLKIWTKVRGNWSLIIRFMGLMFLILMGIPFMFDLITKDKTLPVTLNFFILPVYLLIMAGLYLVFNRNIISQHRLKPTFFEFITSLAGTAVLLWIYYYLHFTATTPQNYHWMLLLAGAVYGLGMLLLSITFFGTELFRRTYYSLFVFGFITLVFYALTQTLWQLWNVMSMMVAKQVYFILSQFTDKAYLLIGEGDPTLGMGSFKVIIGPACSGIESLTLFLGLFMLLVVYEQSNMNFKRAGMVLLMGLIGTYVLNVIRIAAILGMGVKYPSFALGLFHSQAGWVLFSLFVLGLLYFGYGWMKEK
ncbi:archaeosortase/exosortase family protein [Candidatus Woesearchaeota archaeon]|nr:archaeosortase/exosortase family protein [Candidatus Woesearchaeota archaeon]